MNHNSLHFQQQAVICIAELWSSNLLMDEFFPQTHIYISAVNLDYEFY